MPCGPPLRFVERGGIDRDRLGQFEAALEPVEAGGDQAAEREVRVAASRPRP